MASALERVSSRLSRGYESAQQKGVTKAGYAIAGGAAGAVLDTYTDGPSAMGIEIPMSAFVGAAMVLGSNNPMIQEAGIGMLGGAAYATATQAMELNGYGDQAPPGAVDGGVK